MHTSRHEPQARLDHTTVMGGLPVRTDLRAGLSWDDLDDQAAALWKQLSANVAGLAGGSSTASTTGTGTAA